MKQKKPELLIKEAREEQGLTQQEIAESLGIGLRNYQHFEAGRFPKYKREPIKALEKMLGLNIYDIIYNDATIVREDPSPYIETRRKQKNGSNPYLVPFVDIPAQAGYSRAYSNIDYIATLKQYPILPDVDPAGAEWRYFQVDGDSMEDERLPVINGNCKS